MAERFSSETLPGQLADDMAELVTRLRLSSPLPDFSNTPPASLHRLIVMAHILKKMGPQAPDLVKLGQNIISLADLLDELPANTGRILKPSLHRLVDFLESFLHGIDKGDGLESWLQHPHWRDLQRSFANAQTPLAVFDAMEDVIRKFKNEQNSILLSNTTLEAMARRWADVCQQGDLVFGASSMGPLAGLCVVLLLDSEISRHFLREKLCRAGVEVIIAESAQSAWDISQEQGSSMAVLCDQVAPSNHLASLRQLVAQAPSATPVTLVLVTMGDSSGLYSNGERATNLGAQGVWRDPYDLADLLPCILQDQSEN